MRSQTLERAQRAKASLRYLMGRLPVDTCEKLLRTFAQSVGLFLITILTFDVSVLVCWCVH